MIIGLAGYAGAGKDAAGAVLVHRGYVRRAFADPLKDVALRIGWNGAKDDTGRRLLQNLGMAVRDVLGSEVWVTATMRDIDPHTVITDVRFPNEAEAIKAAGGIVVLVTRPGVGPVNGHVSETLPGAWDFDAEIINDGSLVDLRRAVHRLLDGEQATRIGHGRKVQRK